MKITIPLSMTSMSAVKLDKRDVARIEKDPAGLAAQLYLADLVNILKQSSDRYYNDGTSLLSDKAFDALKDELQTRNPSHPFLNQIGAPVSKGSRKVPLPYALFSLDKVKADTLDKWSASKKGPYVVSDKEDGNSLEIVYKSGGVNIYTRGDGVKGQDVTFLAPHLSIPKSIPSGKTLAVRAEAVMANAAFKKYFTGTYRNPRNLVAGAMNKRSVHESIPHIHVIAYEIIEPRMKPSVALATLKKYGFNVVPYKVYNTISVSMLSKLLATRKSRSKYDIDGLVIEQDQMNRRPSAGNNPGYAVAFKEADENQMHDTKVIEVQWEASKLGALKPVLHIQPVELPGNTINYVTGHNAFFIEHGYRSKDKDKGMPTRPIGPGSIVKIIRSGDVIPHVVEVVKGSTKPQMPKEAYKYGRTGIDIYQTVTSDLTREKMITSFFTTVGVEYLKLNTVQKLVQNGFDSIPKILRAKADDFLVIPGFKDTLANKLYAAIQAKTREVELHTLMDASGVFGAGLGEKRMKPLIEAYPSILSWTKLTPSQIEERVKSVRGFNATAKQFALGFPKFIKWLALTRIKPILPTKIRKLGTALQGQTVVFTGIRVPELETSIVAQGGVVGSGVNSNTTILIVKDHSSGSSKLVKAKSLGIRIMTVESFRSKYKL